MTLPPGARRPVRGAAGSASVGGAGVAAEPYAALTTRPPRSKAFDEVLRTLTGTAIALPPTSPGPLAETRTALGAPTVTRTSPVRGAVRPMGTGGAVDSATAGRLRLGGEVGGEDERTGAGGAELVGGA